MNQKRAEQDGSERYLFFDRFLILSIFPKSYTALKFSEIIFKIIPRLLRFITGGKLKFYLRNPQLYMKMSSYIPDLGTDIALTFYYSHLFVYYVAKYAGD